MQTKREEEGWQQRQGPPHPVLEEQQEDQQGEEQRPSPAWRAWHGRFIFSLLKICSDAFAKLQTHSAISVCAISAFATHGWAGWWRPQQLVDCVQ